MSFANRLSLLSYGLEFNRVGDFLSRLPDQAIPDSVERGRSTNDYFGLPEYDETNADYRWPKCIDTYDKIKSDPIVAAALLMVQGPILNAERIISPGDSSPLAVRAAKELDENLKNLKWWSDEQGRWIYQSFHEVLLNALDSIIYGMTADEMVFRYDGKRVSLAKLAPRHPKSFNRFIVSPTHSSELISVEQSIAANMSGQVFAMIPAWKLTLYVHGRRDESFVGRSLLRSVVKPWYYKDRLERANAVGLENSLVGIGQFYSNSPETGAMQPVERQRAELFLNNIRVGNRSGIVAPPGWKFEITSTPAQDITQVLQHYDRQISAALIQQIVTAGSDGGGSYAQAKAQDSISVRFVNAIAGFIAEAFTRSWISQWHFYNYGESCAAPIFQFGPVEVLGIEEIETVLSNLTAQKLITWTPKDEIWIRGKVGTPSVNVDEIAKQSKTVVPEEQTSLQQAAQDRSPHT